MHKSKMLLLLLVVPLFFFIGCDEEVTNENPFSAGGSHVALTGELQTAIENAVAEYGNAGVAVGVKFADDDELWIGTAGKANLNFGNPIEWDDRFKIASISKTYVGTAALLLVKDGLMELDGTVGQYLPDNLRQYVPSTESVSYDTVITVRQLLNHTSGIINFATTAEFSRVQQGSFANWVWQPIDFMMMTSDSLVHEPGARWNYCNTGFIYLQLMIEHLTGNTLGEELNTRVFGPLGLTATEYTTTTNPTDLVNGYWDFDGNGVLDGFNDVTGANPSMAYAAGSIVSNIPDMITWMDELADGTLIGPELQAERLNGLPILSFATGEIGNPGDFSLVAVGLGIYDEYGSMSGGSGGVEPHYWGHAGSIEGYTAGLFRDHYGNEIAVCVNGVSPTHSLPDRALHSTATEVRHLINAILAPATPSHAPVMNIPDTELSRAYCRN
ncbi:MAG: serine hydrolase domain-containing protein [Candidatus Electryoneaceae bacterium]|nr:serine hydrolase domain-containing protein [Candidatus Electryoneaceae bacterium]